MVVYTSHVHLFRSSVILAPLRNGPHHLLSEHQLEHKKLFFGRLDISNQILTLVVKAFIIFSDGGTKLIQGLIHLTMA